MLRLQWQLACALFAVVASADVVPSNQSTSISFDGEIQLQNTMGTNISGLVPLSRNAVVKNSDQLQGNLYYTTFDNVKNISVNDIAYISCNPADYPGNLQAKDLFQQAYDSNNFTATILYSTATDFCNDTDIKASMQEFRLFSMTNKTVSQKVLDDIDNLAISAKYFTTIRRFGGNGGSSEPSSGGDHPQNQNPLGPSPSTAVAMIILYSITGIITALFLVIIITGAIRAHRHPDRYGPRDVLGRPRQSRARGLGRAILDTIPIVKFGEREPPKPADVELGSTSEPRNVDGADAETRSEHGQSGTGTRAADQVEMQRNVGDEQQSGIAPAQPLAAGAVMAQGDTLADEGLGCSICTDDFEKGQDIRVLPCNHKFHPECVDPWLLNVSGTCPLCRVDLRPTTSRASGDDDEQDPDMLAPPLHPEAEASHRRRSAFRDILSLRSRPNASAEERISALRRLREQRHNQSGDVASGSANGSTDDVTAARRSKRMSVRLSDVFGGRARRSGRDDSPPNGEASSSSSQQQHQPPTPEDSAPGNTSNSNEETDSNRRT